MSDSDKAAYIARIRANVPDELKALPIWLLWRSVPEPGKKKPKKVPYYASGGARAAGFKERGLELDCPEDRQQLVTFSEAVAAYERGGYTGLGIALGVMPDGRRLSGIDLDDVSPTDPQVTQILLAANSYAEVSPSGNGVKIFGLGDIGKTKSARLEIYSGARFFTVTGQVISG
jgi:putative DNA primase/helicase